MIEHHQGLVDSWLDQAGAVDFNLEYTQLYADQATDAQNTDPNYASQLIDLLNRAVGTPADPTKLANDSPIMEYSYLAGLKAAVLIHATGDEIVPFSASAELAGDLQAENVPTKVDVVVPLGNQAPWQPAISNAWHTAPVLGSKSLTELSSLLGSTPTYPTGLQFVPLPATDS
jgi:hypothetical protein